ncbi:MAG: lipoyl synthase [Candidatus Bipolaricaulota bacterium]|nr:lipoyl synthase [Candidatus Bipolaricaulota bacterium]
MSSRPKWLRVRAPTARETAGMKAVRSVLSRYRLTTVCQGARCPNAVECWGNRTATFMLLGKICTRCCRFCAVPTGNPEGKVDWDEPERLAEACKELGLNYVVLTSVDRDDLADGGAALFAASINAVKAQCPGSKVEALIPDFSGNESSIRKVIEAGPDVIGHNLETVRRLTPAMRDPRAGYDLSLQVLSQCKRIAKSSFIKSSLMLGLGETRTEIITALHDLRVSGVDAVTLGQYLQPTEKNVPVNRYLTPQEFEELAADARGLGFRLVISGPLVRSSYHAERLFEER